MRLRSSLTFSKKRRGIRYAHNTLLSYFNIHTLYLHKRLSLKLSLAFYSEWLTSKHTENNWVLILRHTGLLLTCETGALWSGALGNQMWVKCCLIKIIFYRYLNLKAEIRVWRLHVYLCTGLYAKTGWKSVPLDFSLKSLVHTSTLILMVNRGETVWTSRNKTAQILAVYQRKRRVTLH